MPNTLSPDMELTLLTARLVTRVEEVKQTFEDELVLSKVLFALDSLAAVAEADSFKASVSTQVDWDIEVGGAILVMGPSITLEDGTWWTYKFCVRKRVSGDMERFVRMNAGINKQELAVDSFQNAADLVRSEYVRLRTLRLMGGGRFAPRQ